MTNEDLKYKLDRSRVNLGYCVSNVNALKDNLDSVVSALTSISECAGLRCVRFCKDCGRMTSTIADGMKCMLSGVPVTDDDYCSFWTKQDETLCWDCRKFSGGCPWSKSFQPVEGWDAIPREIGTTDSFCVKACPLFEEG